jgi:PilZ domain-containing protein
MKSNSCFIVDDQCQILFQEVQQKNLPITIQFRKWRLSKTFTSFLLQVQDDLLVLSIPISTENESPIELALWEKEIIIRFNHNYQEIVFNAQVQEESQIEIEAGVMTQTVQVSKPQCIEAYPRRSSERIFVIAKKLIPVHISRLDSQTSSTYCIGGQLRGMLHDLSNEGIGVTMPPGVLTELRVEDQFELCFVPIPNEEPLLLKTRLRHVTDLPKQGLGLLGFQFIVPNGTEGSDSTYCRLNQTIDLFRALE